MKLCDWCSNEFRPNVSYQIYCSPECRKSATKQKVNDKYRQKKRDKRKKTNRKCSGGCETTLSFYNEDTLCSGCTIDNKVVGLALEEMRGLIEYERFDK